MKKYIKVVLLAALFSFVWGAWWGLYSLERNQPRRKRGPEIRVLAMAGMFPPTFVSEFQQQHAVRLVVTEKNSEGELLREALSRNSDYDLIQINSYISKSFLIDNVFTPLEPDEIPRLKDISIDFKNLDFDPDNKHLVPLTWGLNGFVVNGKRISLSSETLDEMLKTKATFSILPSAVELFNLAVKVKPIIKNWVDTGQTNELQTDLKEIKARFPTTSADPRDKLKDETYQMAQMTNGQAARLVGQGSIYRFVLPKERATLWLTLIGVSRGARDVEFTHYVLNQLLHPKTNQRLVRMIEHATVLATLNDSELPLLQKASFLRQVPLSRVDFFINQEALEPTWLQAVRKEWSFLPPPAQ